MTSSEARGREADPARCPLCGEPNRCALAMAPSERPAACWCVQETFPPDLRQAAPPDSCICQQCLEDHEKQS